MAWELGDSFDFHGAQSDMTLAGSIWATTTGGNIGTGVYTRFGVGVGKDLSNGGADTTITNTFGNDTTIYVNFAFNHNVTLGGTTTTEIGVVLRDGTNKQVGIYWLNNGNIIVTSGAFNGTVLGTWTGAFVGVQWNHYQIKVVINNTTGSVEIRKNGNTSDDYSLTGINTRNGSTNNYANNVSFYGNNGAMYIDDFYVFNDQGAQPNTWQGDVRAQQLMPNSDSSVTWTKSTGASNNACVNELQENGDTNYVSTNTINNVDLYGTAGLSTTPNAIINVVLKSFVRMDDAGPHTYKARMSSGGTVLDGGNLALTSNYQWNWINYLTDPHTSAAWTASGVNAALIGPFDVA